MVRVRGGRGMPAEGIILTVVEDAEGKFLSESTESLVDQFITIGSLMKFNNQCGKYCELTLDTGTKETEAVILLENNELLRLAALPVGTKVHVFPTHR